MEFINIHTHQIANNGIEIQTIEPNQPLPNNFFSIGFHPWHLPVQFNAIHQNQFISLIQHQQCIAIGECGLDIHSTTNINEQLKIFNFQIQCAKQFSKPLIIHQVKMHQQIIEALVNYQFQHAVIIHGFKQRNSIANLFLKQGHFLSFGQAILNNPTAQETLIKTPITQLFLETDTALPSSIDVIYAKAAQLLNLSISSLQMQIQHNFKTIFTI